MLDITYKEVSNFIPIFTNETLYGTTKKLLFNNKNSFDERGLCLCITFPCFIKKLATKSRSYQRMKIEASVFKQLNTLEKNIIDYFKKIKYNKNFTYIKPFVFKEDGKFFSLSILAGTHEIMLCEVKKYETEEKVLPIEEWPLSFGGIVKLKIIGVKIKKNEASFSLDTEIIEIKILALECLNNIDKYIVKHKKYKVNNIKETSFSKIIYYKDKYYYQINKNVYYLIIFLKKVVSPIINQKHEFHCETFNFNSSTSSLSYSLSNLYTSLKNFISNLRIVSKQELFEINKNTSNKVSSNQEDSKSFLLNDYITIKEKRKRPHYLIIPRFYGFKILSINTHLLGELF